MTTVQDPRPEAEVIASGRMADGCSNSPASAKAVWARGEISTAMDAGTSDASARSHRMAVASLVSSSARILRERI